MWDSDGYTGKSEVAKLVGRHLDVFCGADPRWLLTSDVLSYDLDDLAAGLNSKNLSPGGPVVD